MHGQDINFIIGGAHGASEILFKASQLVLSASDLTFPHRLFKIFLIEANL
jgi:23S rRNA pseudoU1915 N3-methylase RlmH